MPYSRLRLADGKTSVFNLTTTTMSTQTQADKLMLKDQIQHTFNRIQYDRSITDKEREDLKNVLQALEAEFDFFFGKEAVNG